MAPVGAEGQAPRVSAPPLPNSYWVIPGKLLAGEYPGGASAGETRERVGRILAAGVDCFIDLTEEGERAPYEPFLPKSVLYIRRPFPDHDIPIEDAHMRDALDRLAQALESGRRVYLHCRAGIGRTGMTIGCHLAESGLGGAGALARLNVLWLGCARSSSWPQVPETPEQIDYVRNWRARQEPAPGPSALEAAGPLRGRFLGALLGLATGDALAASTQSRKPGSFTPVTDLVGGGPYELPRGAWSDDTAMTLCLAESLIEREDFDPRDQTERYLRWQQEGYCSATGRCVGITGSVARALATAQWRRQLFAGSHDPKCLDPEPLARATPAVMFRFADAELAVREAGESARSTCQAPLVIDACRLFGAMLHVALSRGARPQVLSPPVELFGAQPLRPRIEAIRRGGYREREPRRPAGGDIVHALEASLWAFVQTTDFRSGALLAVNLGGDSDVVGAAFGALAGAHYGVEAIPAAWRSSLARLDLLEAVSDRLLARALADLGG